ncbi:MAG: SUMF1/EgtB/PvdO family nonheme iron enzyme [Sandaracinus sp.]
MQCLVATATLACAGCECGTTHLRDDSGATEADGGTDDVDARACRAGEPCDCRAASAVAAGTHWVGADYEDGLRMGPAHRVTLSREVWIGTYEASAGCYDLCIREGPCDDPDDLAAIPDFGWWGSLPTAYWTRREHADLPIVWITPEQADTYCDWLGGRLPTNAEHERIVRGLDGRAAPWMAPPDDPRFPDRMSWTMAVGRAQDPFDAASDTRSLVRIDALPDGRGPYGHFNVIGNAIEWVADDFTLYSISGEATVYPDGDATDPLLAPGTGNRIARSLFADGWQLRDEDSLDTDIFPPGVRCAFDVEPTMLARP